MAPVLAPTHLSDDGEAPLSHDHPTMGRPDMHHQDMSIQQCLNRGSQLTVRGPRDLLLVWYFQTP